MVKPVVIRAVAFRVVGRSENGHLVTVDGVVTEEALHFICHLDHNKKNNINTQLVTCHMSTKTYYKYMKKFNLEKS